MDQRKVTMQIAEVRLEGGECRNATGGHELVGGAPRGKQGWAGGGGGGIGREELGLSLSITAECERERCRARDGAEQCVMRPACASKTSGWREEYR